MIEDLINLDRFPLNDPNGERYQELVSRCQGDLAEMGMFSLEGFLRNDALHRCVKELSARLAAEAYTHRRTHNIYFDDRITEIPPQHPARQRLETVNHTLCADQIPDNPVCQIYEWSPLADFLSATLGKERLHLMADPLARANVLAYRHGEALNWHFDRSEFTTTLLLQASESGGIFQYRRNLRSQDDPNYSGVAALIEDRDPSVQTLSLSPGTLNVFKGQYTAHRITPVVGRKERIVAVYSFYDDPGVTFSSEERLGFYGRKEPLTMNDRM